jgi:hypothetical protein
MGKIQTKNFGVKNILFTEKLNGTNYYRAQVNVNKYNSRFRISGIINASGNEIIPFGEMDLLKEIRVINENTFIIDYVSLVGEYGVCDGVYGSKLYQVTNDEANLLCQSNARTMEIVDNSVVGANFTDDSVTADDCALYPVEEFVYDFNDHNITESRTISYFESLNNPMTKHLTMK